MARQGGRPVVAARTRSVSQLEMLEAEAVHVLRETAAEVPRPVLLFSGGKDSIVLVHLALKAFRPGRLPFPLMHVDTGHNFPEVLEFRDELVARLGERLVVASVQDSIDAGRATERPGPYATRNRLQARTLLDALAEHRVGAAIGGARRDEERSRAKERFFSVRGQAGGWEPRSQRPEVWDLYNTRLGAGEHLRVFPLSNWTELDVWRYIMAEGLELPSIYYAHRRSVFRRDGMLLAQSPYIEHLPGETCFEATVRYRTVGDMTCTGAVESEAATPQAVVEELVRSTRTERGETRADDRHGESAMEDRKREGYF